MPPSIDLPFMVKICGITNEEDAALAIHAGANALGFNFYEKSPRRVSIRRAREIIDSNPGDYLRVGIFVNPSLEEIAAAADSVTLDVLQLHGEDCPCISSHCVWKAIGPRDATSYPAHAYLVDTPCELFGGSGNTFDWRLAGGLAVRVLIAGGLDASNVAEAIATARPWGVDACSRLELRPGRKDHRKVRDFVRAARRAFHSQLHQEIAS
jgi:phosphoribosylanthranilate isomerase